MKTAVTKTGSKTAATAFQTGNYSLVPPSQIIVDEKVGWKEWVPIYGSFLKGKEYDKMGETGWANLQYSVAVVDVILTATDIKLIQTAIKASTKALAEGAAKTVIKEAASEGINQTSRAVLKNGYYEVNGFKFSERYYNKLWSTGRGAPSLVAKEVLEGGAKNAVPDAFKEGFLRYEFGGWEMVYNPVSKEVWHLQPIR